METYEGMTSRQRAPGSARDGDRIRVFSSAHDEAGAGTSSASPGQARGNLPAKNVNFSLFLRPSVARAAQGRCHREDLPGRGGGFAGRAVGLTNEAGRLSHPGEEVKNISRDAEPSPNHGRDERLLGLSSILESTGGESRMRCQGKACHVQVPDPSACSQAASNNPGVQLKRTYEEYQSSSQSDSDFEDSDSDDSERMERPSRANDRRSLVHNVSLRRRGRVNKKLRTLQELLPNCDEVDEAAVLDEAIEYLKTLQQLFLVMSMRSPMYMSPPMMLSSGIHQMYTPYLNQFPPVNVLSGMNTQAGVGCGGIQFPISHGPRTTPASLGSGMLGLHPMARTLPFIPSFGQSSMPALSTQGPSTDLLDSAARSGSGDKV